MLISARELVSRFNTQHIVADRAAPSSKAKIWLNRIGDEIIVVDTIVIASRPPMISAPFCSFFPPPFFVESIRRTDSGCMGTHRLQRKAKRFWSTGIEQPVLSQATHTVSSRDLSLEVEQGRHIRVEPINGRAAIENFAFSENAYWLRVGRKERENHP